MESKYTLNEEQPYSTNELVYRAIYALASRYRRKSPKRRGYFWADVGDIFCVGSTSATVICRFYGFDPDTAEMERPQEKK